VLENSNARSQQCNYQQHGPQVELLKELREENVNGHDQLAISLLHFPDNIHQPFKVFLRFGNPEEIDLEK
jgi:hypothetical protein